MIVLKLYLVDGLCGFSNSFVVSTYLGDTNDHVANEGLDSGDGTSLSVGSIPHLDSSVFAFHLSSLHVKKLDVKSDVGEAFGDGSSLSLNSDFSGFAGNLD